MTKPLPPASRARSTNKPLADLDGRTATGRLARDLAQSIATDLGGHDALSCAQLELVRRAALLGAYLAGVEAKWLTGSDQVDMAEYLSAVDRQRRTLQALGLRRVPKPVESLAEYVARKYPKTHQEE